MGPQAPSPTSGLSGETGGREVGSETFRVPGPCCSPMRAMSAFILHYKGQPNYPNAGHGGKSWEGDSANPGGVAQDPVGVPAAALVVLYAPTEARQDLALAIYQVSAGNVGIDFTACADALV